MSTVQIPQEIVFVVKRYFAMPNNMYNIIGNADIKYS